MKETGLQSFFKGEKEGISALVEAYAPRLIAFLCGYVGKADAEDLTEECFLTLLERKRHFPNEKALRTFLYRTAKHKALNFLRRTKRQTALDENLSVNGLEEGILADERKKRLYAAMSSLTEPARSAVWLVYLEDYSYREAAGVLNCSPKAIDNTLSYAKRKLKTELSDL